MANEPNQETEAPKPRSSVHEAADLVRQLEQLRPQIEARDPRLAGAIDNVSQAFWEKPIERVASDRFKADLAYVLQDVEKLHGALDIPPAQREELSRLAATAPGLQNKQAEKLLEFTPSLADPRLVEAIRDKAADIARESDQDTKPIRDELNALGFQVLTAPRVAAPDPVEAKPSPAPTAAQDNAPQTPSEAPGGTGAGPAPQQQAPSEVPISPAPGAAQAAQQQQASEAPNAPSGVAETRDGPATQRASSLAAAQAEIAAFDDAPAPARGSEPGKVPGAAAIPEQSVGAETAAKSSGATTSAPAPETSKENPAPSAVAPPPASTPNPASTAAPAAGGTTPSPAAGAAAPAGNAAVTQGAASQAASPVSAARAAPTQPAPEVEEEPDPVTKHQVEIVQERLVLGGALGKAVGVVGKSASALGRILEGVTPQDPAAEKQKAGQATQQTYRQAAQQQQTSQQASNPSDDSEQSEIKQRLQRFENSRMQSKRNEDLFYSANNSGHAAVEALTALRETPGVAVLDRIQEAAANNKGGIQAVIAGMRPGGAFEDLRKEFNTAISKDGPAGGAYERAAAALEKYGADREAIITPLASHPNAARWVQHFEKMDAAVGEAASNTPGAKDTTSAIEHLGEKAREIVEKVLEKIQSVFRRDAEARPSPGASPGP